MFRFRKPMMFLAVTAVAMCCSVTTAHAGPISDSPSPAQTVVKAALQYVGTLEGVEEFYDAQAAESKVQQAVDSGMNTIRVRLRWKYTTGAPSVNTTAVCNLAHSAEEKSLKAIILSLEPDQAVWPLAQTDMDRFLTNIGNYDQGLFDPGSNCIAHPSKLQVMWMIGNEPNVQTFCNGADKDPKTASVGMLAQHQKCAERMALLYHQSYAYIQKEKFNYRDSLKYDVDLKVIVGGLSSNDAPLDLLTRYFKYRQDHGYTGCDMNYFGFHPYGYRSNAFYGLNMEPKLAKLLKANGCDVPIFYTEMGYLTAPPLDGSNSCPYYDKNTPEADYMPLFTRAFSMTLAQGVVGYINMKLNNEACRSGGWSSGLYESDGKTPKPFHDQVRDIFLKALNSSQR